MSDLLSVSQEQYDDMRRERDEWKSSCALYHTANAFLDKDRSALLAAVRNLRDAKGLHNSYIAYERLLALLPESTKTPPNIHEFLQNHLH